MRAAFATGMVVGVLAVAHSAYAAGKVVYEKRELIAQVAQGKSGLDALFGKPDLFKSDMYIAFDTGKGVQVYRVTLHGHDDLTGDIEDVATRTKGVTTGHLRAGAVSLEYASKDPNRPGFGNFVLRPYVSAVESDTPVYSGLMTFHSCNCTDGTTTRNGPILVTQAVMSSSPVLSDQLKTKFFQSGTEGGPKQAPVRFPENVQEITTVGSAVTPIVR